MLGKKSKYTEIIVGVIILLISIIGIGLCYIAINYSQVAHKYSKEAIGVLRDYKESKISNQKAISELESLLNKANKEKEEKSEDTNLYLISSKLNNIVTSMKYERLDRLDIEEYIKELNKY